MNINSVSNLQNQTSFEARIKMKKPNIKALTQVALGSTAVAAGVASAAETGVSMLALTGPMDAADSSANIINPAYKSIPENIKDIHEGLLTSAGGRYDAAGYVDGIPVQSSVFPAAMAGSAVGCCNSGINAFNNAKLNGSNISAPSKLAGLGLSKSAASTKDSSLASSGNMKAFSNKNPISVSSSIGTGLMSTGLPIMLYYSQEAPATIGASTFVPGSLSTFYASTESINNGKSNNNFIKETFSSNKKEPDKKLPS